MPHQSRVCAVFFDSESEFEASARFWGAALGRTPEFDADGRYATLRGDPEFNMQHVKSGHQGMHLDIETDNVAAEVARLEKLGARKKYDIKDWTVLEAPGGHAFCVVPVYTDSWPAGAQSWP